MKPIIVGEAPSKNEPLPRPLEGRIGHRLADYAGITYEDYLVRFERLNLLHVRQDTLEKGFEFDAEAAAKEALRLRLEWAPHVRTVILLGRRVGRAFGVMGTYFDRQIHDHDFYIMPHPSGINRWWNEPANQEQASDFLKRIVRCS